MPKLSIITINYNNKIGLEKTIESVINQTDKDFEYVIIDGNSNDGSKEVLEKYKNQIDIAVSEPDTGIYNAMNKGILLANGEYLLFLNSGDNLFSPEVIELVLPCLHSEDVISGNLEFVGESTIIGQTPEKISFEKMVTDTLWHPCSFIKKEAFKKYSLYDEGLKICADWKWFLLGFFKNGLTYKHLEQTISTFYIDGISSKLENKTIIKKERESVLQQEFISRKIFKNEVRENQRIKRIIGLLKKNHWLKLGLFKVYKWLKTRINL
ncbi:MAG: glycosyltransferase family 2 protein [Flavobacteriales bacterium]